ncbi:transposase [Burkholderia cepacia]|uniref:transposase n=1 Tax=Burkholderia cepacia TaxID=292 RepID=UPI001CF535F0|nr:transposase [Burkholderia cepacia]
MHFDDKTWKIIAAFVDPGQAPSRGRPHASRRAVLSGIVHVLVNDISWHQLPIQLYRVSGNTCWRQFREWVSNGVWLSIEHELACILIAQGAKDAAIAFVDAAARRIDAACRRKARAPQY